MRKFFLWLLSFRHKTRSPIEDCEMADQPKNPVKEESTEGVSGNPENEAQEPDLDNLARMVAGIRVGDRLVDRSPRRATLPENIW